MNTKPSETGLAEAHRQKVLAATRCVLRRIAKWTCQLYDVAAEERLTGKKFDDFSWSEDNLDAYMSPGAAGPRIENSIVLLQMARICDVVTTGVWQGTVSDMNTTRQDLMSFHWILQYPDALMAQFESPFFLLPEICSIPLETLDAFEARRALLNNERLEIRALAALAGLSEKTVRMAAIRRGGNPELATFKDGARVYVSAAEVTRWLSTKPSFRPTTLVAPEDAVPPPPRSEAELGAYLQALRTRKKLSPQDLAALMRWTPAMTKTYMALEAGDREADVSAFDIELVCQLTRVLNPDARPEFALAVGRLIGEKRLEQTIFKEFELE
jgi:transcriptional regulator with XRE-family HTH domain